MQRLRWRRGGIGGLGNTQTQAHCAISPVAASFMRRFMLILIISVVCDPATKSVAVRRVCAHGHEAMLVRRLRKLISPARRPTPEAGNRFSCRRSARCLSGPRPRTVRETVSVVLAGHAGDCLDVAGDRLGSAPLCLRWPWRCDPGRYAPGDGTARRLQQSGDVLRRAAARGEVAETFVEGRAAHRFRLTGNGCGNGIDLARRAGRFFASLRTCRPPPRSCGPCSPARAA